MREVKIPKFILDIRVFSSNNVRSFLSDIYSDIICLTFDIESVDEIEKACEKLKELLPHIQKPLMIRGSSDDMIDKKLIPELIKYLDKPSIIATVNENNYKEIVPFSSKGGHTISVRTPIDINLAKEMNILTAELGQPLDKILIDSDIGGLGYGLDYGYSMIEKIKLEDEKYLNLPIISFVSEESLKTKEAKSNELPPTYGKQENRAIMFEITSVSSVIAAGADYVVVNYPETIKILKGVLSHG